MSHKPMWDWMDKMEGKKEGSSHGAMMKERERQGYGKKNKVASKMKHKCVQTGESDNCKICGKAM